jgi:RNA polymerase primary sigma factor
MPRRKTTLENIPMYQYGQDVQKALERSPFLDAEEEKELITKAKTGDRAARDRVIESQLLSVISVANKYRGRGVEFADLIQEGNMGLLKAIDRFEITRGTRFNTYALWWVRHKIQRFVHDNAHTIRIPVHHQDMRRKQNSITRRYLTNSGCKPTNEEMAKECGISLKRLYKFQIRDISYQVSLTRGHGEYSNQYLDEIDIEDQSHDPVDIEVQIGELVDAIEGALVV